MDDAAALWFPGSPDRIIAANAMARQVPLITQDRVITKSGLDVVWEGRSPLSHLANPFFFIDRITGETG